MEVGFGININPNLLAMDTKYAERIVNKIKSTSETKWKNNMDVSTTFGIIGLFMAVIGISNRSVSTSLLASAVMYLSWALAKYLPRTRDQDIEIVKAKFDEAIAKCNKVEAMCAKESDKKEVRKIASELKKAKKELK